MTVPTQHMKEVVAGEVVGWGDRNGNASRNFPQLTHVGWDPGSPGSENGGSNHVSASTRYEVQCCPTMWPRSSPPDGGLLCFCTCFNFTPPFMHPGLTRSTHSPEESHLGRSTQCSGRGCRCCPWQPVSGFPGTRSHLKQDSRSLSKPCTYMASGTRSRECGFSTRVS